MRIVVPMLGTLLEKSATRLPVPGIGAGFSPVRFAGLISKPASERENPRRDISILLLIVKPPRRADESASALIGP